MTQHTLFDEPAEVEAAREDAMSRAHDHAPPEWLDAARRALAEVAAEGRPFTADHVWLLLARRGVPMPHEPAALGPLFRRAAREGRIRKTGRLVRTRFARRHRDLVEWQS